MRAIVARATESFRFDESSTRAERTRSALDEMIVDRKKGWTDLCALG